MENSIAPVEVFYIVGCQRSGTTLMRLVLGCHSKIECFDEFLGYKILAGRITPTYKRPIVGFKVPCLTEQLLSPTLYDHAALPESPNPYRGQKLIFMIRDARDVVASMVRLNLNGLSWLDLYCMPAFADSLSRNLRIRERCEPDLKAIESCRFPAIAKAALFWRFKVESMFDYLTSGVPVLTIKYEEMVAQPSVELRKVCSFLNLEWENSLLQHDRFQHTELTRKGLAVGNTVPNRPIDVDSVGKWRDVFTPEELEELLHFAGETQSALYPNLA